MYTFNAEGEHDGGNWAIWGPMSVPPGGSVRVRRLSGPHNVDVHYTVNNKKYKYTKIANHQFPKHFKTDSHGSWVGYKE